MIRLAVHTGIPPSVWAEEGEQTILTALEILFGKLKPKQVDPAGRQMSG